MQFDVQDRYYREQFPGAVFQVILLDGRPAGRLYVDHRDEELRIIDIALLPEHRGAGVGGTLLPGLLDEATQAGKPARIHVDRFNPAFRPDPPQRIEMEAERLPDALAECARGEGIERHAARRLITASQ